MADIFSTISLIAFVLAGVCVIAAIALFFALNTKAAYLELKGQPQKKLVTVKSSKSTGKSTAKQTSKPGNVQETPTSKIDVDDEAVTTLDSGEAVTTISVMNVYEPGTEIMEEDTESVTEIETNPGLVKDFYDDFEVKTAPEPIQTETAFKITKKVVIVNSNELLR